MSLTSAAITELTSESAPYAILNEWLRLWFDGNLHAVGNNSPVLFPKLNFAFGQGPATQPMHSFAEGTDAEIRCVIFPRSELEEHLDTSQYSGKLATAFVLLHCWVSAKKPGSGQSEAMAQSIAQLLKAILSNPDARYPLMEKGFRALQPKTPEWLRSADYAKRLVPVIGQLQYPILFGENVVTPTPDAGEQSLNFTTEEPLIAGSYLLGAYQWNARRIRLTGAVYTAWLPTVQPVVLGLEVGGVLTGDQITIPVGTPNVDTIGVIELNVLVPVENLVRWKVLSAPAPENSAWHVTVDVTALPQ